MSRSQEYVLCASCGREWAPRRPDSQKLKCPTCGKYRVLRGKDKAEFKKEAQNEVVDADTTNDRGGIRDRDTSDPGNFGAGISDQSDTRSGDAGMLESRNTDPAVGGASAPVDKGSGASDEKPAGIGLFAVALGALAAGWFLYCIVLAPRGDRAPVEEERPIPEASIYGPVIRRGW